MQPVPAPCVPPMGKIQHVGKQDSLLEILLCMLISHCFVWLGEIGRKETRQWMVGIVGQDGVFGCLGSANGY